MEAFCHAAPFGHLLTTLQAGNGSAQGDLLQDTDLAREPVKEPSKRWRNWYRVEVTMTDGRKPGVHCGENEWPSKEVAEAKALYGMPKVNTAEFLRHVEYLGAYPEGERP